MTGSTTLHTPEVQRHQPIDLLMPREAEAVSIAPAAFHAALAPLLEHRRAQGYAVELIDVAEIYDVWNSGQVDPQAIRRGQVAAACDLAARPAWCMTNGQKPCLKPTIKRTAQDDLDPTQTLRLIRYPKVAQRVRHTSSTAQCNDRHT